MRVCATLFAALIPYCTLLLLLLNSLSHQLSAYNFIVQLQGGPSQAMQEPVQVS